MTEGDILIMVAILLHSFKRETMEQINRIRRKIRRLRK